MTNLNNLIDTILCRIDSSGNWHISRDEILESLNLQITDVYSSMVTSKNPLVKFGTSSYSDKDTGALICLLECFGYKGAPAEFWKSGLWIPYEIQIELQGSLIESISIAISRHKILYDSFLSIFDNFRSLPRSLDIYLEEYFSRNEITGEAVYSVLKEHPLENEGRRETLLKALAGELFRREIIPYRNLFSPIFIDLRSYLIKEGRIDPPRKPSRQIDETRMNALRLFSYTRDQIIVRKDLKDRYKNLMKQYHPDINPEGLEQAKAINRAYSLLLPDK